MKGIRVVAFTLVGAIALAALFVLLRRIEVWIGARSFLSGILAGVVLTALAIARMIYSTQRKLKEMRQERLRVALPAPLLPVTIFQSPAYSPQQLTGRLHDDEDRLGGIDGGLG